jgi:ATP-binding cassette subfamily F protein uup
MLTDKVQQIMKASNDTPEIKRPANDLPSKKLSFKERTEFDDLDKVIPLLQNEKQQLEKQMNSNLSYNELQKISDRIGIIIKELDDKEMRWLELSERR